MKIYTKYNNKLHQREIPCTLYQLFSHIWVCGIPVEFPTRRVLNILTSVFNKQAYFIMTQQKNGFRYEFYDGTDAWALAIKPQVKNILIKHLTK